MPPLASNTSKMPSPDNAPPLETALPPLVVIIGPTGVGKTALALELAARLDGEIISADSRQFYRGMDIGTAKATLGERQGIPHHLIDFLNPDQPYSLAEFQADVIRLAGGITERGRCALLVGGTGQYVRAVTEGWIIPEQAADPRLRLVLEKWGAELGPRSLHARLAILDPEAARNIEPDNLRRTVRALEVTFLTGRPFSSQRQVGSPKCRALLIGLILPRPELYAHIDARIGQMLAGGLLDEMRSLLVAGYPADLPAFSAIGYAEMVQVLAGSLTLEAARMQMQKRTRTFVRQQANWFKPDDPNIHWLSPGGEAAHEAIKLVEQFLGDAPTREDHDPHKPRAAPKRV